MQLPGHRNNFSKFKIIFKMEKKNIKTKNCQSYRGRLFMINTHSAPRRGDKTVTGKKMSRFTIHV